MRVKPMGDQGFWDFSGTDWEGIRCWRPSDKDHRWVRWNGREWLRKSDSRSLSEIAGYHVAEAIGIPVQPWAAFFERCSKGKGIRSGILVERMHDADESGSAAAFATEHPLQIAQFLAFTAFQRLEGEDPEFLRGRHTPLKLIDLDGYGPHFRHPLKSTDTSSFVKDSEAVFCRARAFAVRFGIEDAFKRSLGQMLIRDPTSFFDFSGHPDDGLLLKISSGSFRQRVERVRRMQLL